MTGGHHFGSRLVFSRDETLFVTLGDRNIGRASVQTLDNHIGKVVRIDRDGKAPADNPYLDTAGARPELWSVGHRNVQGAALHPVTGELWTDEHGPKGGDELNRTLGGRNYGWPLVTYGREYSGGEVSDRTEAPGTGITRAPLGALDRHERARCSTRRTASRNGAAMRSSEDSRRRSWCGSNSTAIASCARSGSSGTCCEQRIRDIEQGPDGALYLLTDEDAGSVLRVVPAD